MIHVFYFSFLTFGSVGEKRGFRLLVQSIQSDVRHLKTSSLASRGTFTHGTYASIQFVLSQVSRLYLRRWSYVCLYPL